MNQPRTTNWIAGSLAGLAAGIVATIVQLALWWTASYPVVDMLLRDSRLAAAIVMGRSVLPPPSSFDVPVILAASLVHFALSIAYGMMLAPLAARLPAQMATLAGVVFGLLLYVVNMYGFTLLFPWFDASRDWITAAAHASFGACAAIIYQYLEKRVRRLPGGAA